MRRTTTTEQVRTSATAWLSQNRNIVPTPDVNQDNILNQEDAQILYYTVRFETLLQANPALRQALLGDLADNPATAMNNARRLLNR